MLQQDGPSITTDAALRHTDMDFDEPGAHATPDSPDRLTAEEEEALYMDVDKLDPEAAAHGSPTQTAAELTQASAAPTAPGQPQRHETYRRSRVSTQDMSCLLAAVAAARQSDLDVIEPGYSDSPSSSLAQQQWIPSSRLVVAAQLMMKRRERRSAAFDAMSTSDGQGDGPLYQSDMAWRSLEAALPDGFTPGVVSGLQVGELIARGTSSDVFNGTWGEQAVVVKVLRSDFACLKTFSSEVTTWRDLRHPHVCSLLGVTMIDEQPGIVLEYASCGTLATLLQLAQGRTSNDPAVAKTAALYGAIVTEGDTHVMRLFARIAAEVALGLAYLHDNGVIHRDIKPANILLAGDSWNYSHGPLLATEQGITAKVTDFGLSTRIGRKEYTGETGTYRYMAPEVIMHQSKTISHKVRACVVGSHHARGAEHDMIQREC